jgi:myosin heavy subunit
MPEENVHGLSSMPPPASPGRKKKSWLKKPVTIIFGLIGVIASTSTVVGLVQGWFDPEPTAEELVAESAAKLEQIKNKLDAKNEDAHLVNQVSRRVTELKDQFVRIQSRMKDIGRLDKSLAKLGSSGKILTPDQKKLREASRKKETEELLTLVNEAEKMVRDFIDSVEEDDTLSKVETKDSRTGQTKAKALEQARMAQSKLIPELKRLKEKYGS